jgi:cytoskeleton protein RodZ
LTGNDSSDEQGTTPVATQTTTTKKQTAKERAAARKRARQRRAAARRARTVDLRIVPEGPTYVCLDKGIGTPTVYENTLTGPKSWKGKHLRINLGRRSVRITVNGKQVKVPVGSDPIGFDFRPTRTRELPLGQRPCA